MWVRMSSSRDSSPRSACSMIAKAVNCFEVEPMLVRVSGLEGDPVGEVGRTVGLRVDGFAVPPDSDRGAGRFGAVEARHHLVGEFLRVGGDGFVAQQGDREAAGGVPVVPVILVVPRGDQLDRVRTGALGAGAEALGALAEPAELPDPLPAGSRMRMFTSTDIWSTSPTKNSFSSASIV